MTGEQLKSELIRLIGQRHKEFGILVRRMGNQQLMATLSRTRVVLFHGSNAPGSISVHPVLEAYKVFRDGHEEPHPGCISQHHGCLGTIDGLYCAGYDSQSFAIGHCFVSSARRTDGGFNQRSFDAV